MKRTIFDDEHQWFRESARAFVERTIMPVRDKHRQERVISRDVWLEAGRQGFLGLGVPAEHGGTDIEDFRFNAVLGEELSRAGAAYASAFAIHIDIVAPYLLELSTEGQRERWLSGFANGQTVAALAMTEPDAGSDLAGIRTAAHRSKDGWSISGAKTFITNGSTADLIVVAARTGKSRNEISLFVVEAANPGFARGQKLHKIGQHEADTAELFFNDAWVPADSLLGEVNRGFAYMMERLPQERLSCAVANVAHAKAAVDQTLAYVRERSAFGRPIGTFQHNRFVLAEIVTRLDVAQSYVDSCLIAHVAGSLSAVDAAKAKWWTAETENQVIDACVQLHGGYGYMEEYEVARAWSDARVTKIWAGSNEIMKEIIGRDLGLGDVR